MGATVRAGGRIRRRRFTQEKPARAGGVNSSMEQKCVGRWKRRQRCCGRHGGGSRRIHAHITVRWRRAFSAHADTYSSTIASERT